MNLSAESMEELSRRCEVADLHVSLGAELEESLETSRGMFRALPLIAMGEEKNDTTDALPLRFTGSNELVNDYLSSVCKVSKLRFPDAKHLRVV